MEHLEERGRRARAAGGALRRRYRLRAGCAGEAVRPDHRPAPVAARAQLLPGG